MIKKYFKDFDGSTASIIQHSGGSFNLKISIPHGKRIINKNYLTYRGARNALGKLGQSWQEKT